MITKSELMEVDLMSVPDFPTCHEETRFISYGKFPVLSPGRVPWTINVLCPILFIYVYV